MSLTHMLQYENLKAFLFFNRSTTKLPVQRKTNKQTKQTNIAKKNNITIQQQSHKHPQKNSLFINPGFANKKLC
jgi:hypothetical protein